MNLRNEDSVKSRREKVEALLGIKLPNIGTYSLDETDASTRHCENMIGVAQVPLGIAGPLLLEGKEYFLPLATTEGALVASVNRGAKALFNSGGIMVSSERYGQTRGPVFLVKSLSELSNLERFIKGHFEAFNTIAQNTSSHLTLLDTMARGVAHYLFVRFSFDTKDAMGMNMVTIATQKIAEFITEKTKAECLAVAGNFDTDKKPAFLNSINNRGFAVWAEAVLPKDVVIDVLKTTPEQFYETWFAKCMLGSVMSGSMGFNAQYANIIAALFIATGQDPAHVVEGSMGVTVSKVLKDGNLYVSVYLPALILGTVGGGTNLATQKESLNVLGLGGNGHSENFAEILAGACLAGEVSLLSSISQGTLSQAHLQYGRGKKV